MTHWCWMTLQFLNKIGLEPKLTHPQPDTSNTYQRFWLWKCVRKSVINAYFWSKYNFSEGSQIKDAKVIFVVCKIRQCLYLYGTVRYIITAFAYIAAQSNTGRIHRSISTHWGLATLYGVGDLGQHWFRQWLVAWRHQAITWVNVDLSSVRSCGIHLRILL